MDVLEMEMLLRNLDHRMSRVEQILPTLVTTAELAAAIAEAVAPLATKAELSAAIAEAVAPLATKAELVALGTELRVEIHEEAARSRRHMDIATESLRDDIRIVAEAVVGLGERIDRLGAR